MVVEDLKQSLIKALKEKDSLRVSVFRMLLSEVKNFIIDNPNLTDEDFIKIVSSQVKKRKESIEAYKKAGREELVAKESEELEILSKFLPEQISEEEVRAEIEKVIKELGAESMTDFGKVMGKTMQNLKGKADGNMVNLLVKQALS